MVALLGFALFAAGCGGGPAGSQGRAKGHPGQAGHKGIFPGASVEADVLRLLGKPAKKLEREGDQHWIYPPDVKQEANWVRFDKKTGKVRELTFNHHWRKTQPQLADFVAHFGKASFQSKLSHYSPWSRVVRFKRACVELIVQNGDDRVLVEAHVDPARFPSFAVPKKNPYTM